jgi:hypothetical protein
VHCGVKDTRGGFGSSPSFLCTFGHLRRVVQATGIFDKAAPYHLRRRELLLAMVVSMTPGGD